MKTPSDSRTEIADELVNLRLQGGADVAFVDIRHRASRLEALYGRAGLVIPARSGLAHFIRSAVKLADAWERGETPADFKELMVAASYLDGIATAALWMTEDRKGRHVLKKLLSGGLGPFAGSPSIAKDALWEMQLGHVLGSRGFQVDFGEPDLHLDLDGAIVGIACKKFYSEKNVRKTLSIGVEQIARSRLPGVLGINIDDLLAPGVVAIAQDKDQFLRGVNNLCAEFVMRHEEVFHKYLSRGRSLAALVSSECFGIVAGELMSTRQFLIWVHPGLNQENALLMRIFRDRLLNETAG